MWSALQSLTVIWPSFAACACVEHCPAGCVHNTYLCGTPWFQWGRVPACGVPRDWRLLPSPNFPSYISILGVSQSWTLGSLCWSLLDCTDLGGVCKHSRSPGPKSCVLAWESLCPKFVPSSWKSAPPTPSYNTYTECCYLYIQHTQNIPESWGP